MKLTQCDIDEIRKAVKKGVLDAISEFYAKEKESRKETKVFIDGREVSSHSED